MNDYFSRSNLIGLLVLLLIVLLLFLIEEASRMKKKRQWGAYYQEEQEKRLRKDTKRRLFEQRLFVILSGLPIIGEVLVELKRRIYFITPYTNEMLFRKTLNLFKRGALLGFIAGCVAFLLNVVPLGSIDMISTIVALVAVYVVFKDYTKKGLYDLEEQADADFTRYLAYVKHEYYAHKKVGEAVLTAAENVGYDMRVRAKNIYDTAYSPNAKETVYEYVNCRDRGMFYRLFITQVYHAGRNGDKWKDAESLFCKNIDYLRRDIPTYRIRRKERRAEFTGYTASILIPLLVMNVLRRFGNGFSTEMNEFYQTTGYIVQILNIFMTLIIYNFFNKKKDLTNNSTVHLNNGIVQKIMKLGNIDNRLKGFDNTFVIKKIKKRLDRVGSDISPHAFLVKIIMLSVFSFIVVLGIFLYGHGTRRKALSETIVYEDFLSRASVQQQENVINVTLQLIDKYLTYDMRYVTESLIVEEIDRVTTIRNLPLKQEMAKTIIRQVEEYKAETLKWYEIVVAFVSMFVGYIHYAELSYYDNMAKQAREDEVRMFQMIVLLEKEFDSTSVSGLLAEFESHAIYFKEPLRVANLMYARDKEKALDSLFDYETPEFVELITNLKTVYKCGIKAAFSETELNMLSDAEIQRVNEDIMFRRSMDLADILRMMPAAISFGLYFLIPFLFASLGGIKEAFDTIQNL